MKRILLLLLAAALLLTATACAGEEKTETEPQPQETEAVQATQATEAAGAAETVVTEPSETTVDNGVDLQALYEMLAADMPEMILLDETMMLNFYGIEPGDYVQAAVATCADGLRTDELWLIQAVDEDALARLKDLAQTRLRMKGEESITYSPEQYAVVEKAQILTDGLYLAVIVSPDVDALAQTYSSQIGD